MALNIPPLRIPVFVSCPSALRPDQEASALPILVFREEGIDGGVFDRGIVEDFTHVMPAPGMKPKAREELRTLFQRWAGEVRERYHGV